MEEDKFTKKELLYDIAYNTERIARILQGIVWVLVIISITGLAFLVQTFII